MRKIDEMNCSIYWLILTVDTKIIIIKGVVKYVKIFL